MRPEDLGLGVAGGGDIRARSGVAYQEVHAGPEMTVSRMRQTCHFRKRASSAPADGPAYGLDFARHCEIPPDLCRRGSGLFTEVARLVPPEVCIFILRRGAVLPLHDHPGMHVFGRLLYGRMRSASFEQHDNDNDNDNDNNNSNNSNNNKMIMMIIIMIMIITTILLLLLLILLLLLLLLLLLMMIIIMIIIIILLIINIAIIIITRITTTIINTNNYKQLR